MAAVDFTAMPCEPNLANQAYIKYSYVVLVKAVANEETLLRKHCCS